jgi:transposase InsO family protein
MKTGVETKQALLDIFREAQARGCRLGRLCDVFGTTPRTVERWKKEGLEDRRRGAPKRVCRKMSEEERAAIEAVCCSEDYRNMTPHEIVPILADKGRFLGSESSFYRVLRSRELVRHPKKRRMVPSREPEELKAGAVHQLWSWDITYMKSRVKGRYFYLYLYVDIFSRAIMGWEIHETENAEASAALCDRLVKRWKARGVLIRSDNGGPMRAYHMLATMQELGVVPSFSRPSVSNDNPFSEALFKTVKYTAGYPDSFQTIEEARAWMVKFAGWYNHVHLHSGISYVTPMQRHSGRDVAILAKRHATYAAARAAHPERWARDHKSWNWISEVYLRRPGRRPRKKIVA